MGRVIERRSDRKSDELRDHTLYGITDTARLLGMSARMVRGMVRDGYLHTTPWSGKDLRISGLTIRRYIERHAQPQPAEAPHAP